MQPKIHLIIAIFLVSISITACSSKGDHPQPTATVSTGYVVEVPFREFYNMLGGVNILGPAISGAFSQGDLKFQFTSAGLMVYDSLAPADQRFLLAPLGLEMKLDEPPLPSPVSSDPSYVEGHFIAPEFIKSFQTLGGIRYVGKPLAEARFNPEFNRYEQYFQNLGFYKIEGDPSGRVYLLAYGAWKCGDACASIPQNQNTIRTSPDLEAPFADFVSTFGRSFTGVALSEPYLAPDGKKEQVFGNMILYTEPDKPDTVKLRSVRDKLELPVQAPGRPNNQPGWVFVLTSEQSGYNIPPFIMDYITSHGGWRIFGQPITELKPLDSRFMRQCFEHLCLDYDQRLPEQAAVQPAPLGYTYLNISSVPHESEKFQTKEVSTKVPTKPVEKPEVSIQVWLSTSLVTSNQEQNIGVSILENNKPLVGAKPELVVTMPDASRKVISFPSTGENGQTSVHIPPVKAMNGTLVPYQVCLDYTTGTRFCVKDTYLIWNTP